MLRRVVAGAQVADLAIEAPGVDRAAIGAADRKVVQMPVGVVALGIGIGGLNRRNVGNARSKRRLCSRGGGYPSDGETGETHAAAYGEARTRMRAIIPPSS